MSELLEKFEQIKQSFMETTEVDVLGFKFTLGIMSSASDTESHEAANPYSKIAYLYALKIESLARSIRKIDGNEIPEEIPTGETVRGKPEVLYRVEFLRSQLGQMPQEVVDVLWRHYGNLAQKIGIKIDPDHPLRNAMLGDPSPKELQALGETDVREVVARGIEESRIAQSEEEEGGSEETDS